MNATAKIVRYEARNVARSRWMVGYGAFFLVASFALLRFSDTEVKAALSLANLVLAIVPLVSLVLGTMYLYDAREFTELLLAQPVGRGAMYAGLYLGLALPLTAALLAGAGIPLVLLGGDGSLASGALLTLLGTGVVLTWIFLALALLIAVRVEERARGLGVALAVWLLATVLYDGLILLAVGAFADYPLERPLIGVVLANPADLARVVVLLRFDIGALMGYTGAIFERFFGSFWGTALAVGALALWLAIPLAVGARSFCRRDF
ncbi:MAG TPA: ABC transporter permease subunit [Longimicrobiaceae bacterium]|jgi:Cu-processing system permease protein|nr:ABC transporter permease subunit [Longimicrobiaceae bacterium]